MKITKQELLKRLERLENDIIELAEFINNEPRANVRRLAYKRRSDIICEAIDLRIKLLDRNNE